MLWPPAIFIIEICHVRLGMMFFTHLIHHNQGYDSDYFIYNILTTLSVRHGLAVAMIIGEIILSLMLSLHECDHAPQCIHTWSVIHNPSHTHVFVHHPASLILIYIQNCGNIRIYGGSVFMDLMGPSNPRTFIFNELWSTYIMQVNPCYFVPMILWKIDNPHKF